MLPRLITKKYRMSIMVRGGKDCSLVEKTWMRHRRKRICQELPRGSFLTIAFLTTNIEKILMTMMTIDFYMVVKESPARIVKVKPRIFWRQLGSVEPSSEEDSCKANFDKSQFWDTYVVNIDKMSLQHEFKGTCEILAIDS